MKKTSYPTAIPIATNWATSTTPESFGAALYSRFEDCLFVEKVFTFFELEGFGSNAFHASGVAAFNGGGLTLGRITDSIDVDRGNINSLGTARHSFAFGAGSIESILLLIPTVGVP